MSSPATTTPDTPDAPVTTPPGRAPATTGRALRQYLPMGLLAVLFLLLAAFVASQADTHGRTWDEGAQDWYGEAVYQWYATSGDDLTFMRAAPELQMPQHGPFFETVVATAQHVFEDTDRWRVRSLVGGVAGVLGVAGIALCGLELGGWWVAFLAALGLTLYPRYTGAVFNNSKDIPLAVAMIFLLWLTLRLTRRWHANHRYLLDSALIGICLGVAVAIRVNALLWVGVLALTAAGWWLIHRRTALTATGWRPAVGRQLTAGAIIAGFAYLTALACWPYLALYPVDGLVDSIRSMSRYTWTGVIPFEGEQVRADQVPRRYAAEWLIIGSPLPTVLFGLIGLGLLGTDLVRRRLADPRLLLPAGLLLVPLAALALMRPTLYNGLRHFLFVVPGLVLLGAIALVRLWSSTRDRAGTDTRRQRLLAAVLVTAAVLGSAEAAVATYRLYPFEYMYFSPVVGGYASARDRYEGDYWGVCQNPALAWLVDHHGEFPSSTPPSVGGLFDPAVRTPAGFGYSDTPDFFITGPYYPMPAGYQPIHSVEVEDRVLCAVTISPAYAPR